MPYSEQQLRETVDIVFAKFDADHNDYLDQYQVKNLISEAFKHMGKKNHITKDEVNQFIKAADTSGDGRIQKEELFQIFKKVIIHQNKN